MSKIRDSARDQECLLRLPGVCCGGTHTTVWAHSNRSADGKGLGLKAHDRNGTYACYRCHAVYDRQAPRPATMSLAFVETAFTRAMEIAQGMLKERGLWESPAPVKRPPKSRKTAVPNNSAMARMAKL